MEYPAA